MENEQRTFRRFDLSTVLPGGLLQSIVVNAVFPYMFYQLLIAHTSDFIAYLVVALIPLLGIAYELYQRREIDWIGVSALLIIASSCIESFVTGDERILLLRMAQPIALVGAVVLLSLFFPRPILFYVDRFFSAHGSRRAIQYKAAWENNRQYHAMIIVMDIVWGVGQLLIAAVLIALFFNLTVKQFSSIVAYVQYIVYILYIVLIVWTVSYRGARERSWRGVNETEEEA